jgi:hypothetical protein
MKLKSAERKMMAYFIRCFYYVYDTYMFEILKKGKKKERRVRKSKIRKMGRTAKIQRSEVLCRDNLGIRKDRPKKKKRDCEERVSAGARRLRGERNKFTGAYMFTNGRGPETALVPASVKVEGRRNLKTAKHG